MPVGYMLEDIRRKFIYYFLNCKRWGQIWLLVLLFCSPLATSGQRLNATFLNYIERYHEIAVQEAQQYGVPASITLAQGLLESGAGQSNLARKAHNHFGIKCHRSWHGPTMNVGDSAQSICYRKYARAEDSYEDHARFLQGKRYAKLYELKPTDYKGWAHGLQQCGYAENPTYATLLISLIERYGLDQYDTGQPLVARRESLKPDADLDHDGKGATGTSSKHKFLPKHHLHRKWGLHYVLAEQGDTYESIATEFSLKPKDLREMNDVPAAYAVPGVGDMVWVERKAKQAPGDFAVYTVRSGDDLWLVSQAFGLRLKSLAHMNGLSTDAPLQPGQKLRLQ